MAVTAIPWPMGTSAIDVPDQYVGSKPVRFAGEVDVGGGPETVAVNVVEKVGPAQPLGDLDGADVRRVGQDVGDRPVLGGVVLGVVEGGAGHAVAVGDGERCPTAR